MARHVTCQHSVKNGSVLLGADTYLFVTGRLRNIGNTSLRKAGCWALSIPIFSVLLHLQSAHQNRGEQRSVCSILLGTGFKVEFLLQRLSSVFVYMNSKSRTWLLTWIWIISKQITRRYILEPVVVWRGRGRLRSAPPAAAPSGNEAPFM